MIKATLWRRCVIVLLSALAALWYGQGQEAAPGDVAHWVEINPTVLENRLGLVGRIEAARHVTLAAPFEGAISQRLAQDGQQVGEGQALLTLDTGQLDITLREAQAQLLKARAGALALQRWAQGQEVAQARRTLNTARSRLQVLNGEFADTQTLFGQGIVARMEVDSLRQQVRTQQQDLSAAEDELARVLARGNGEDRRIAEMERANAEARYQALEQQRAQRIVRAPFAGLLTQAQQAENSKAPAVEAGRHVNRGEPLWRLVDTQRLQVVSRVEEADLHQLVEGMPVEVSGEGFAGVNLSGKIVSIAAQGNAQDSLGAGAYYDVRVAIDEPPGAMAQRPRLGMSARLSVLIYRSPHGIAVPAEALHSTASGASFVRYRRRPQAPSEQVNVRVVRAVSQGVEVQGLAPGWVEVR